MSIKIRNKLLGFNFLKLKGEIYLRLQLTFNVFSLGCFNLSSAEEEKKHGKVRSNVFMINDLVQKKNSAVNES